MTRSFTLLPLVSLSLLLVSCGDSQFSQLRPAGLFNRSTAAEAPAIETDEALTEEETAEEEGAEAPAESGQVGITVASLGDPTIPGLWLETGLVSAETPGRVVSESGQSLAVTLRPSGGAASSGSRISVAAMQALGLNLTDLATLTVIVDG